MNYKIVIALAIVAHSLFNYSIDGYSYAESLGRTLGGSLFVFGIAYFIVRNKDDKAKVIAYSIAIVLLFASSLNRYFDKQEEKQALAELSGLLEDSATRTESTLNPVQSTDRAEPPISGKGSSSKTLMQNVLDIAKKYTAKEAELTKAFQDKTTALGVERALSDMSLRTTLEGVRQVRGVLDQYEREFVLMNKEFDAIRNEYKSSFKRLLSEKDYSDFLRSFNKNVVLSDEYVKLEREAISEQRNLLSVIEKYAAFNQLQVSSEGAILIPEDSAIDEYNRIMRKINAIGERQEAILRQVVSNQRSALENINKVIQ